MKVLSVKEPFATLIKDKVKIYETRSGKTNARLPTSLSYYFSFSILIKNVNTKHTAMANTMNIKSPFTALVAAIL